MSAPPRPPSPPRPPRPPSLQRNVPGAPRAPRSQEVDARTLQPYPDPPANWSGPLTEWVVWWWLTKRERYVPNRDFVYQPAIGTEIAVGGPTNSKGFVRADFLIVPQGQHGPMGYPYVNGLVINPITPFTHPSKAKDQLERSVFATLGYLEVFIDGDDLTGPTARPATVMRLALRGVDVSMHR